MELVLAISVAISAAMGSVCSAAMGSRHRTVAGATAAILTAVGLLFFADHALATETGRAWDPMARGSIVLLAPLVTTLSLITFAIPFTQVGRITGRARKSRGRSA